jgi:hypothetical protein
MTFSTALLSFITRVLGVKAGKAAKALVPAAGTVVAVGIQWLDTGHFDKAELATSLTGFGGAALSYIVPNLKAKAIELIYKGVPVSHAVRQGELEAQTATAKAEIAHIVPQPQILAGTGTLLAGEKVEPVAFNRDGTLAEAGPADQPDPSSDVPEEPADIPDPPSVPEPVEDTATQQ